MEQRALHARWMLDAQKAYLVIDGGALQVGVGILRNGQWLAVCEREGEALQTIFDATREVLHESGTELRAIDGFITNAGPGSVLGIRLACIAISGWMSMPELKDVSLHTYRSIDLVAVQCAQHLEQPFIVAADYREGRFIAIRMDAGSLSEPVLMDIDTIGSKDLVIYRLPQRKVWKNNETIGEVVAYPFVQLPELVDNSCLLRPADTPEPFVIEAPEYAKWDAQRHR